jgi:hypothetical protein
MPYAEKRAWIMLVVSALSYAVYAIVIVGRADGVPLADVPYVSTLLWAVGASIVVSIVLNIAVAITSRGGDKQDQRDREINRAGEYIGQSFVVIGGVAALLMAMAEWPYFWIANAVYSAFTLSALLGSIAKIMAYRKGFPW